MIVMKFGGTSVGIPDHFRTAVRLVGERAADDPVVVVSALMGVTNLLVDYARHAGQRAAMAEAFVRRHAEFVREVRLPRDTLSEGLDAWSEMHARLLLGREPLSPAERDELLAFGERLSATLFAAGLCEAGTAAVARHAGEAGLVTDEHFGAAHPLPESRGLLRASLGARPPLPVVTGFVGRAADGRTTTLGRGGSDYSAALIAAALDASEIQIWTDTSGMLSADPQRGARSTRGAEPVLCRGERAGLLRGTRAASQDAAAGDGARHPRAHPQHAASS